VQPADLEIGIAQPRLLFYFGTTLRRARIRDNAEACLIGASASPMKTRSGGRFKGGSKMRTERVSSVQSGIDPTGEYRDHLTQESQAPASHLQLRIARRPERNRVQRLRELADTLLRETETLARDKAFTEESNRLQGLNLSEGVNFYDEVQRFETGLILLALDQTGGHQARAAQLLNIKPTTLNSKIKHYGIEY
jgi:DNA-binding protein Fis